MLCMELITPISTKQSKPIRGFYIKSPRFHRKISTLQNIDCFSKDGDQFKLKVLVVWVVVDFN